MKDGLTTEEHEVLANYHMNNIENYLNDIIVNITRVNKKPNIELIEKRIESIKCELEIVKFYTERIENAKNTI